MTAVKLKLNWSRIRRPNIPFPRAVSSDAVGRHRSLAEAASTQCNYINRWNLCDHTSKQKWTKDYKVLTPLLTLPNKSINPSLTDSTPSSRIFLSDWPTFNETGPRLREITGAFGFATAIEGCAVPEKANDASRAIARKLSIVTNNERKESEWTPWRRKRRFEKTNEWELWTQVPPNNTRVPTPIGLGPAGVTLPPNPWPEANCALREATVLASSYVVPPTMKMIMSCGLRSIVLVSSASEWMDKGEEILTVVYW